MESDRFDGLVRTVGQTRSRREALRRLGGVTTGALALALPSTLGFAPGAARAGGTRLTTTLTGAAVVPGPGDPDGSGTALLRLNPGKRTVCFELQVSAITLPATGAHIQRGTSTEAGPVVVFLTPPDATGTSSGCVTASRELIQTILRNPEQYYVQVHTVPLYAAGAIRGQLG
jgi:hypothetical protein